MKYKVVKIGVAVFVVLLAWLLWPQSRNTPGPSSSSSESESPPAASSPSLSPSPLAGRRETESPIATAPSDGLVECEIHATTFGDPAREVEIQEVDARDKIDVSMGTVRIRTKAGARVGLFLRGAAVSDVRVEVPDPVPPRIEVRVPPMDDPRLADPVLLVVDEKSGKPLPTALFDPGSKAPEEPPVHADAGGLIRIPRALSARLREFLFLNSSGIISEANHFPRAWNSLFGMNQGTLADWAAWDATGAMRVRLEPFPADQLVPRRTLRVVGEDGSPLEARLVLMRTPGMGMLMQSPLPARTDGSGNVVVVAPAVASYDIYDGACLVGTFVMVRESMAENGVREIRVPKIVRVHVIVRGLAEPKPNMWLRGPEVVSLDPDEKTGWARIDGEVQPGWKAFSRADGSVIRASEGLPVEMDMLLPRGRPVALEVAGREALLKADEPTTIELDWSTLQLPRKEPGNVGWSLTRAGLDEMPGHGPSTK